MWHGVECTAEQVSRGAPVMLFVLVLGIVAHRQCTAEQVSRGTAVMLFVLGIVP